MANYELPGGIRPVYRGIDAAPSSGASSKEILERFELWRQNQAALKAANEAAAELPAKIAKLEVELRKKREREEAKSRTASLKKQAARDAQRRADKAWKKAMREPLAWKAALKALEKMPPELAKSDIRPIDVAYSAYSTHGGRLTREGMIAELAKTLAKRRS